jgi:hypothetical protein
VQGEKERYCSGGSVPLPLSQGNLLNLLAELHDVPPAKEGALKGRLQHFQRLGFPAGVNTGRGKPAEYGVSAILRIVVAFEMLQLGIMPERAIGIVRLLGPVIVQAAGHGGDRLLKSEHAEEGDLLLFFDPCALGSLTGLYDDTERAISRIADSIYTRNSANLDDPYDFEWSRRQVVVNVSSLVGRTADILDRKQGISENDLGAALLSWADTFEWRRSYG